MFSLFLMPSSNAFPEVEYPQPIPTEVITFENMSVPLRPICHRDNGTIYFQNATTGYLNTLYRYDPINETFVYIPAFGGGVEIKSGIIANDGSLLIGLNNRSIYRSEDDVTFSFVHNCQNGTYPWRFAILDNYVYAGEYGTTTDYDYASLWRSDDNGTSGSWSEVAQTMLESGGSQAHIHYVGVDPTNDDVYYICGDIWNASIGKSTDGTNFSWWGIALQGTSMAFDEYNIYIGDDPPGFIWTYNRTTKEFLNTAQVYQNQAWEAVYEMVIGEYGVIYAKTSSEGQPDSMPGVYMGVNNGRDFVRIFDDDCLSGQLCKMISVDGYIWFISDKDLCTYRFQDLTMDEAITVIYGHDFGNMYKVNNFYPNHYAYDGERTYIGVGGTSVKDPAIVLKGVSTKNLIVNSSFEDPTGDPLYLTPDWRALAQSGKENDYIANYTTEKVHSGNYAIKITGFNYSRTTWLGTLDRLITLDENVPSGRLWFSFWYNLSATQDGWESLDHRYTVQLIVQYLNDSYETFYLAGDLYGYQTSYWAMVSTGNMSSDQWMRYVNFVDLPATIKWIKPQILSFGKGYMILDDIMLSSELAPYSSSSQDSSNIQVTVDDQTYSMTGELSDGGLYTIQLEDNLINNIEIEWVINGSRIVDWWIVGYYISESSTQLIAFIFNLIPLGIVASLLSGFVMPIADDIRNKRQIKFSIIQRNAIKTLVYIIIAIAIYEVMIEMFM